jgi:hypothetical protein
VPPAVEGDRTVGGGEEEIEGAGGAGGPGHGQQAGEYLYGTNHHDGGRLKIWVTFCLTSSRANTRLCHRSVSLLVVTFSQFKEF